MKLGLVQFSPTLGEPETNRRAVSRLVAEGAEADLLVLPELCNSGYNFLSREEAAASAEPLRESPFVDHLQGLCALHRCFIASGFCERDGDRLYNSAVLVGPEGLIGHYRKAHLFLNEKSLFTPGDLGFPVFELDLGLLSPERPWNAATQLVENGVGDKVRVGMLICFDWQFPEVWRILALEGAQIACHPSNLVLPGKAQRAVPFHAMINRIFAVTANRTGVERGLSFTGRSLIADPSGDVLFQAGPEADEVGVIEIDPRQADDKSVTPRNDLITDRRVELYGPLLEAQARTKARP